MRKTRNNGGLQRKVKSQERSVTAFVTQSTDDACTCSVTVKFICSLALLGLYALLLQWPCCAVLISCGSTIVLGLALGIQRSVLMTNGSCSQLVDAVMYSGMFFILFSRGSV